MPPRHPFAPLRSFSGSLALELITIVLPPSQQGFPVQDLRNDIEKRLGQPLQISLRRTPLILGGGLGSLHGAPLHVPLSPRKQRRSRSRPPSPISPRSRGRSPSPHNFERSADLGLCPGDYDVRLQQTEARQRRISDHVVSVVITISEGTPSSKYIFSAGGSLGSLLESESVEDNHRLLYCIVLLVQARP